MLYNIPSIKSKKVALILSLALGVTSAHAQYLNLYGTEAGMNPEFSGTLDVTASASTVNGGRLWGATFMTSASILEDTVSGSINLNNGTDHTSSSIFSQITGITAQERTEDDVLEFANLGINLNTYGNEYVDTENTYAYQLVYGIGDWDNLSTDMSTKSTMNFTNADINIDSQSTYRVSSEALSRTYITGVNSPYSAIKNFDSESSIVISSSSIARDGRETSAHTIAGINTSGIENFNGTIDITGIESAAYGLIISGKNHISPGSFTGNYAGEISIDAALGYANGIFLATSAASEISTAISTSSACHMGLIIQGSTVGEISSTIQADGILLDSYGLYIYDNGPFASHVETISAQITMTNSIDGASGHNSAGMYAQMHSFDAFTGSINSTGQDIAQGILLETKGESVETSGLIAGSVKAHTTNDTDAGSVAIAILAADGNTTRAELEFAAGAQVSATSDSAVKYGDAIVYDTESLSLRSTDGSTVSLTGNIRYQGSSPTTGSILHFESGNYSLTGLEIATREVHMGTELNTTASLTLTEDTAFSGTELVSFYAEREGVNSKITVNDGKALSLTDLTQIDVELTSNFIYDYNYIVTLIDGDIIMNEGDLFNVTIDGGYLLECVGEIYVIYNGKEYQYADGGIQIEAVANSTDLHIIRYQLVPEPTSASFSILALTALLARRRRKQVR